ncbi:MAG: ankyrin repeat domain-containing protein [Xenococcaceae cyanobacterium]
MEFEYVSGKIIFDRYEIIDILGKGGIGITYAAIDLKTKEKVALKAVSLQQLKDWKQVELLEREASVLAQLNHPAIPKYLDYFQIDSEDERIFYIVQELAPGKSLFQLVESGWRTNETEIKRITIQILDIFSYLHSLNPPVIHRDIKPHNLILGDDGKIFLVDFGAVQNTYYNTLMQGSTVVGTYGYMAPEQFKGKAKPATDLYGLGATILYLLTHRSPNELPQDTLTIDFRSSVNISEGFSLWLEKILQPDLEERFSSAKEALEKLNSRFLFTNALTSKWKVVFNLGLVGAIALTLNSYKWGFLSRLGYYPSELCSYSDVMKNYIETGGNLNITLLEDPKFAGDDSPKIKTDLWRCILNEHPDKHTKELVELLIAKGADINARDKDGRIPLFWAARNHQYEVAELLIAKGVDVNSRDHFGYTSLMWAMSPEEEEGRRTLLTAKLLTAELLIAKGANVNARDYSGITSLHQAARNHRREVVEFLISKGANVNARDNNGLTPLSSAAGNHNHEVIELLIAKGADVNSKDNNGLTPLLWAVNEARNNSKSELSTVKLLIYQGADVNFKDKDGNAVLLMYGARINPEIAKLLIIKGADVNARDKDGNTPLIKAIEIGEYKIAKLLIDRGADVNARNIRGWTPLSIINKRKSYTKNDENANLKIKNILIEHGAKE